MVWVSYQIKRPVSHGDDGILGEDDGLAAVPWHSELGEDDAGHASLDDHAQDALEGHYNDGEWTLLCRRSETKIHHITFFLDQPMAQIGTNFYWSL